MTTRPTPYLLAGPCSCAEWTLSAMVPWLCTPETVHTTERCGPYVVVALDGRPGKPQLRVLWPEDVKHTKPADSWRTPVPSATTSELSFRDFMAGHGGET